MTTTSMTPREERGLEIAQGGQIVERKNGWSVRSQTRDVYYLVRRDNLRWRCTCRDFELRQERCKHIYAVEFVLGHRTPPDEEPGGGERETTPVRPTYPQNWPAYNLAQTREKSLFMELLHALCVTVSQPEQGMGRPRLPLGDMIFACVYKVYSGISSRRFTGDLEEAYKKGLIRKAPHFNSVMGYLSDSKLAMVLSDLVMLSSLPLVDVERTLAVDSSGFGTCGFMRWFSQKYGRNVDNREWVKLHLVCGVKTHVVISAEVSDWSANDSPYFVPLVEQAAQHFNVYEILADKAYLSHQNLEAVVGIGGTPYIPFKSNTVEPQGDSVWSRMYHSFMLDRPRFLEHYRQRSNVESVFSMMKSKFGDSVRSKSQAGQVNEVLCKVICHNLYVLIHAMFELGIEPDFCVKEFRPRSGAIMGGGLS